MIRDIIYPGHDPYLNLEILPENITGWSSNDPSFDVYIKEIRPKSIIEVGTWLGASAIHMCKMCLDNGIEDFEIVCIDTFEGCQEFWNPGSMYALSFDHGLPTVYMEFLSNVVHKGYQKYITPFPIDSQNGYMVLKKNNVLVDMVYIDGAHDYYSVKNDLQNYKELIRSGGILLGDDFHHGPIKTAVQEVLGNVEASGSKFVWKKI